jgi:hypothetical protein
MGRHIRTAPAAAVIRAASAVALASGALTGPAQAETGTCHQSFEGSGPEATCQAPEIETPWQSWLSGQQEWTPSWAQWPNKGAGGWVCNRTIVWAQSSGPTSPFAGCVAYKANTEYVDFQGGYWLTSSAPLNGNSSCTGEGSGSVGGVGIVYSPPRLDADALCPRAFALPDKSEPDFSVNIANGEA